MQVSPRHILSVAVLGAVLLMGAPGDFSTSEQIGKFPAPARQDAAAFKTALVAYPRVVDADTLVVEDVAIHLFGIDAPDAKQSCKNADNQDYACGTEAIMALVDHIHGGLVSCDPRGIDGQSRVVAVCHLGSEDLNAWIVAEGWAVADRGQSADYVPEEEAAWAAQRGIWAGSFTMPWEWRQLH